MDKPVLVEHFCDNGAHDYWELVDKNTGFPIWSEDDQDIKFLSPHGIRDAIKTIDRIARTLDRTASWTLLTTFWEDSTFKLEYRHGNSEGIHRFIYEPHLDKKIIRYKLDSVENLLSHDSGFNSECLLEKVIHIS